MILVTGATGMVGGHLLTQLLAEGVDCRALVRDPNRLNEKQRARVEVVEGDFDDPSSLALAMKGVKRVLLLAPLGPRLAEHEANTVDAAVAAGVVHVVKISTLGVTQVAEAGDARVPRQYPLHRQSEERLERSGLAYTHLRAAPFMQNTLNFAPSIKSDGLFRGSWGTGRMAYVDVRDVAAAAVRALTQDGHEGKAYALTGPESLSSADVASRISDATGHAVQYVDVPVEATVQGMIARGVPEWFAGAMGEVQAHIRSGHADTVTDEVARLTGAQPRSFAQFCADNRATFGA
jgi:uncharacterized protein YbjT (DUF2867 family)